jgi:hypothetical protein
LIGVSVYRVNWLRAREGKKRAEEEVNLVEHEMEWTTLYFRYKAEEWTKLQSEAITPGHTVYAAKQTAMWKEMAEQADQVFRRARKNKEAL